MRSYRSSIHEMIRVSPNEMVFGRPIIFPVDLVLGVPDPDINKLLDLNLQINWKIN